MNVMNEVKIEILTVRFGLFQVNYHFRNHAVDMWRRELGVCFCCMQN